MNMHPCKMQSLPMRLPCWVLLVYTLSASVSSVGATEYYVSTSGNDTNPGTITQPFRTLTKGVSVLQAGDILNLRQGIHVVGQTVDIAGKNGTQNNYIVIRSYKGEQAYIDGSFSKFDWTPAFDPQDPTAHPDEYISDLPQGYPQGDQDGIRGAFLDRNPYTRLITYSKLEDLRAENETFEKITDPADSRPGPNEVMLECNANDPDPNCMLYPDNHKYKPAGYRYPWVYMGPGIWLDKEAHQVHIRLSHTHNNVSGLADYTGEVDPRKVKLALSPKSVPTLYVHGSSYLRFENLSIRHGGEYSLLLENVTGLVFDHVRIFASSYGVRMGNSTNTRFLDCTFDGGMPTWYFRSDRKSEYFYKAGDRVIANLLGKQTLLALLLGSGNDTGTEIANSEFFNAHDLYIAGKDLKFHHNWINNLNDEALFLDAYLTERIQIYQNVITKSLSAISFASSQVGGARYLYRNLIDLRSPTAGYRPRYSGDQAVWRYGQLYKSNSPDGPLDLFQNTFLVYAQAGQAAYTHYRDTGGNYLRRSFNNLFIAVNSDVATTFLPSPSFPGPTDGNDYYRMSSATVAPAYRYLEYPYSGKTYPGDSFPTLDALKKSVFFEQSKRQYPPGYEANSIESNPQFRRIGADGVFRETDDLRLGDTSPAIGAGVRLPDELQTLDPFAPSSGNPDIGSYPYGSGPLQVGIDNRRSYPKN